MIASDGVSSALTTLSDDERLFRDSVYEFADREIRPHVREMDETAHMPRTLIDKLFDLGVMGIEIPEASGGGGGTFNHPARFLDATAAFQPTCSPPMEVVFSNISVCDDEHDVCCVLN